MAQVTLTKLKQHQDTLDRKLDTLLGSLGEIKTNVKKIQETTARIDQLKEQIQTYRNNISFLAGLRFKSDEEISRSICDNLYIQIPPPKTLDGYGR
jgi:chromosome segregation ATPase